MDRIDLSVLGRATMSLDEVKIKKIFTWTRSGLSNLVRDNQISIQAFQDFKRLKAEWLSGIFKEIEMVKQKKETQKDKGFDFSIFGDHADYMRVLAYFVSGSFVNLTANSTESSLQDSDIKSIDDIFNNSLNSQEYNVTSARLAIFGKDFMTLECLGKSLGVTKERIRQIETKAFHKLHHRLTKSFSGWSLNEKVTQIKALETEISSLKEKYREMEKLVNSFTLGLQKLDESEMVSFDFSMPVSELELSIRSAQCLQNANIETMGQLVVKKETELLAVKNFGRKTLLEIKEILFPMGLSLGMKI